MVLTLKTVNAELAKRGYRAQLEKGSGDYYFWGGEAANWLDQTVRVPTLDSLTLEEWLANFERLRKLNEQIVKAKDHRKK